VLDCELPEGTLLVTIDLSILRLLVLATGMWLNEGIAFHPV